MNFSLLNVVAVIEASVVKFRAEELALKDAEVKFGGCPHEIMVFL